MNPTATLEAAAVLAAARRERFEADAAEARLLQRALDWANLHQVTNPEDPRTPSIATYGDTPVSLAGLGAPHVAHFAVLEFGTVLRMSRRATEALFADVIELGHRLPRTWDRVTAHTVKPWRARQIARATQVLSPEAAAHVDAQVAPFADRIGPAELQRLVDAAIAQFMPTYAEQIAATAEESQFLQIATDQPSYTGTCRVLGELDLADAQDLEQALQAGAEQQKALGSPLPLAARRAKALGNLARGEIVFDYNSALPENAAHETRADLQPPTVARRHVTLYVHLGAHALRTGGTGLLENAGAHLVTADQIRVWCGTAGSVTVQPVLDLDQEITTPGYRPTERLTEQVTLRDRWCPFPYCEGNARHGDKDHIEPYRPDGPTGQTTSSNLGSPCRTHHRLKTFGAWTYTQLEPGRYLWRSPHGYVFLKDRTGTRDLTPRPVEPPGG